jgi:hypothetical protein
MPSAAVKGTVSKKRLVRSYFFYEVLFLTLLEDCSERRKRNNYRAIRPAGAAKKDDPITAPKAIANGEVGSFGLGELGVPLVAETIAQNKKHNQCENRQKDHNYRNLDGDEQYATKCQDLAKQCDDQENKGGDACDSLKKYCHLLCP